MDHSEFDLDEQFIRDTVNEFLKRNRIPFTRLGEILGYQDSYSSKKSYHGKQFVANADRDITIKELGRVAQFLHMSPHDLLRPIENHIQSKGRRTTNILQTGSSSKVLQGNQSELDDVLQFLALSKDERHTLISLLKRAS